MVQLIQQEFSLILTVIVLTISLNLILKTVAHKISLVDRPDARKSHKNVTPLIGGICIYLACSISFFIFDDIWDQDLRSLIVFSGLYLFLGMLDDRLNLKASSKLLAELMISLIFVTSTGLQISNLGNPFGLAHTLELGLLSLPFTIFAIVGLMNAFNMIDGCDGLAASLAVLTMLAVSYFGLSHFEFSMQILLLMLVMSVVVFLFFNFSNNPALKVFLGDGGSLFLGFIVSVLLVKFAEVNQSYSPSIVLWFVAVPVFDFCAVVARRLLLKRKIMSADRSHLHHYLLSFGLSHFQITMVILFTAITFLCLGAFLEANYPSLSLFAFVGLFTIYLSFRLLNRRAY